MKGLELSEKYYLEYGKPMLEIEFGNILDKIAVGLAGSGSECFGYDDEISKDHDFEAGFCIFLPDESVIDRKTEFALERSYAKLPKEFMGIKKSLVSPVGGSRHGVIRLEDFFAGKTGSVSCDLSLHQWLTVSENSLLEASNGKIFFDGYGLVTSLRKKIAYFPEDIRLKRLAGNLLIMAQAGQYNYQRCLAHGENGAAQLAIFEFVRSAVNAVFLLNKKYMPYYKWSLKALGELEKLSNLRDTFEFLICSDNDPSVSDTKSAVIEDVASIIIGELQAQNLTEAICLDLEKHAYSVNDGISDAETRNLHILASIN